MRIFLPAVVLATSLWAGTEYPALPGEAVVPNQLLVRYKSGTAGVSVAAMMLPGGQALPLPHVPNLYLVQVPPGAPSYYSTQLSQNPLVEYVEPNRIRHTTLAAPNDSLFVSDQWDLTLTQAQQAWQLMPGAYLTSGTAGTGRIKVAVIDTGADCTHPDFINAGGASQDAASGGQILFSSSEAIVSTTISSPACLWEDDFGHGTHVSGTIAAATNNAQGVAALGYAVELIEIKAMDNAGNGNDANLSSAIHWAVDNGASVINMSLGEAQYSQTLQDAVNYAWQRNSLVVAAAGNDGVPELFFPAGANHAMGVAATTSTDARASFSNTGSTSTGNVVDIAAPGMGIWSMKPTYAVPLVFNATSGSYGSLDGTSMASPHVAALAGLIAMTTPNLSATAIAQRIQQSADATDASVANGGWGTNQGYGRINASRAIAGNLRSASVGGIVGQVVNSSGTPVSAAKVTINSQSFTTDTTPTGIFRFINFVAGNTYPVTVTSSSGSANASVAVVAGADTTLTIVLGATTGTFNGTVSDGVVPISGVVVEALSGGLIQATATTDSGGDYSLTVPVGTYDIQASCMYCVTTTVPSNIVTASGANVPIQMAKMGNISGTVLNSGGSPVANSQITITGTGYSAGAVANGSGVFTTIPLPAGTYSLTATGAASSLTGVVVTNDNTTVVTFSQNVTVTTVPAGLQVIVDSVTYTAPQSFNWTPGSNHSVNVTSPQTVGGTRGTFASWSDTGAQSHTVTAPASGSTATFTATFSGLSYLLTLTASPSSGGTVTPNPTSPTSDGFYASGTAVQVTATANTGFTFGGFSGDLTGTTNPQSVAMSQPRSVTANFGAPVSMTVTTNPAGLSFTVDGTPYNSSQTFPWTPGTPHTIATSSPQAGAAGTRYTFASWSDGLAISHAIIAPSTTTTYTANFSAQYLLTLAVLPAGGGTLTPVPASPTGDGYYNSGTSVQVTETPAANFQFGTFSGDLTGITSPQSVVMSAPRSVTGTFVGVVSATITTNPAGLLFKVDGIQYTGAQTFVWASGSSHGIGIITISQSPSGTGTRYTWANWSDSGAQSHTVIAPVGGTAITYTANFNVSAYLLTLAASPTGGGVVSPNPGSPTGDGYYPSGTPVVLTAIPSSGFQFTNFLGDLTGSGNPQTVMMSAPHTVTASFSSGSSGGGSPLAGNWKLNESFGAASFSDASGNGNTGACSSGACPTMGVPGKTGTAASFNGTNDRITIPDSPSLRLNQFTIVLWVYPKQMKTDYQPLVVKEDASGTHRNYGLYIVPNSMQVRYAAWAGDCATRFAANSTGQLTLNTWNQIAFTYDGLVEKFYINGMADSSNAAASASLCQFGNPVNIGMEIAAFLPFSGALDNVQIYNQALSASSVSNLYNPLAAYWKLDEFAGATSFADASGDGNTGTCGVACPAMGVPGKVGTAASFNGLDDQIAIPDSPSLRLNQFTIALWVYPKQIKADFQPLVDKNNSTGDRNYGLLIVPNSMQVRYSIWAGDCATKFAANSAGQLTLNTWNHVAFTYDGAVERLYINGILDSSNAAPTASLCQTAVPVNIGMVTAAFLPFNGMLDDIQIYNQALSTVSVASLFNSPAGYWKLDETSGATSFTDASGNGNTGACSSGACPAMGVPGRAGTAATFNGSNDQITIPDSPSLRLNQFTIALWVYPTQEKSDYQTLLMKASSGLSRNYGLQIVPNSLQVRYSVWAADCATRFASNSAGSLILNTWNYVVFTYDGVTASLYLNGLPDSSIAAATASLCQAAVPIDIGNETAAFLPFSGILDDVRIYNQALSATGVSNLYSSF